MSDIRLFSIDKTVKPIELQTVLFEKELQHLVEENMGVLFGVRFIKTEHPITISGDYADRGGRIDSLGIDENNCPVIFEYKRNSDENVITQGLFYLDWLLNHQAEFKSLVSEKLGDAAAENIDWSSPAVYCIANSFGQYDLPAIKQMNRNIRLIRYAYDKKLLLFEYLNAPSTKAPLSNSPKKRSADKTFAEQYAATKPHLREIVDEIKDYVLSLGTDVSENELKFYLALKKARNIVCIEVNNSCILLHLALDPKTVEESSLVRNVANVGHWGTGDVEIRLSEMLQVEEIRHLLKRAYLEN